MTTIRIMIPARLASTRLPEKLLLRESGKTVILHTFEAAENAAEYLGIEPPVICYDDDRLCIHPNIDIRVAEECASGTDRIAAALRKTPILDDNLIINIQADEPLITTEMIRTLIDSFYLFPTCDMATLATPLQDGDADNPDVVKVLTQGTKAVAFQRNVVTHNMDDNVNRHVGIYAYRAGFVKWFSGLAPCEAEVSQRLEQERARFYGCRIRCAVVDHPHYGIDTRADYDRFLETVK